jgi:hypothetical protein
VGCMWPINGGGPNDLCKDAHQKEPDKTEDSHGMGFLLTHQVCGNFVDAKQVHHGYIASLAL